MAAHLLNSSSCIQAGRKPQLVRAHVVPHARRQRFKGAFGRTRGACGPNLVDLSPFDALFDISASYLLENAQLSEVERARPMAVDFVEDRQGFRIKADVPGVAKQDITLDVDRNVVTISAKRSSAKPGEQEESNGDDVDTNAVEGGSTAEVVDDQEQEQEEKLQQDDVKVLRHERYDLFQSRSFRVPKTADLATISAKYVDGVLTVDIKKNEGMLEDKRTIGIA